MERYVTLPVVDGARALKVEVPIKQCEGKISSWRSCELYVLALPIVNGPVSRFCSECAEREGRPPEQWR